MSELKAFDVGLGQYCEDGSPCIVAFDADRNPRILSEKVYLKSEVDKVIAHHKYKRCLGEAMMCQLRLEHYEQYLAGYIHASGPIVNRCTFLISHYKKWCKRWLELADKFKEAK